MPKLTNKLQIHLLILLKEKEVNKRIKAKTLSEITEMIGCDNNSTLYKALHALMDDNYIAYGIPDGNKKTFFITSHGEEILNELNEIGKVRGGFINGNMEN